MRPVPSINCVGRIMNCGAAVPGAEITGNMAVLSYFHATGLRPWVTIT